MRCFIDRFLSAPGAGKLAAARTSVGPVPVTVTHSADADVVTWGAPLSLLQDWGNSAGGRGAQVSTPSDLRFVVRSDTGDEWNVESRVYGIVISRSGVRKYTVVPVLGGVEGAYLDPISATPGSGACPPGWSTEDDGGNSVCIPGSATDDASSIETTTIAIIAAASVGAIALVVVVLKCSRTSTPAPTVRTFGV